MFILKALLIIEKVPHHSKIIISLCVCVFTVHRAVYYFLIMRWWCSNLWQRLLRAYDPLLIVTWIIKYPTLPHPPLTSTYFPPSGPPNPTPCPLSLLPVKPLHSIIWPLVNTPSPSQHTEKYVTPQDHLLTWMSPISDFFNCCLPHPLLTLSCWSLLLTRQHYTCLRYS